MNDSQATASALPLNYQLQDRFQIQSILTQEGGFSNIYIAWDLQASKHVVVKEIAPHDLVQHNEQYDIVLNDEGKAALFSRIIENSDREAAVLRELTAKGITGISSYITDFTLHNTHYIVMEWVKGRSLASWDYSYVLANETFPVPFLESVLSQLLKLLSRIHEAGYYHCDIKPQNIIVSDEGIVTLIDFGAVRSKDFQHDANVAITPGFSPPEFYPSHRAQIGPWTDLYMLGAMVYNTITRKIPESADIRIVRDRLLRLSAIPGLVDKYPDALLNSVSKALSVVAAERFADADAWLEFYEGVSKGRQIKRAHQKKVAVRPGAKLTAASLGGGQGKHAKSPQRAAAAAAMRKPRQEGNELTMVLIILGILGVGVAIFLLMQQS